MLLWQSFYDLCYQNNKLYILNLQNVLCQLYLNKSGKNNEKPTLNKQKHIFKKEDIAKCWKQPKCPSVDEWIKNCGALTQWNTMQQDEGAPTFLNGMD